MAFQQLSSSSDMEALPDEHPVLCSWLEADDISQTLITSWQTATTGFDLDFDNYRTRSTSRLAGSPTKRRRLRLREQLSRECAGRLGWNLHGKTARSARSTK